MVRLPIALIEGKKLPRVIFSMRSSAPTGQGDLFSLMRTAYEIGVWCFDLPSARHLRLFDELRALTEDDALVGLCHLEAEEGVSFLGKPLRQFEGKVVSTIQKNLDPSCVIRNVLSTSEVFTQKEIDRIGFDFRRFDQALSRFDLRTCPFLLVGETYGDWLLALGRIDLLREMLSKVRSKGFIPVFSSQWPLFSLPKAKPLDAAAYAVSVSPGSNLLDVTRVWDLLKKFDKPVIAFNVFGSRFSLQAPQEAFDFLLNDLKICSAIVQIASKKDAERILEIAEKIPSLIPQRRT